MTEQIYIRKVTNNDINLLFEWVNDSLVIENSLKTIEKIDWPTHKKWFDSKINNKNARIYIFENVLKKPIGQVRIEKVSDYAKISFSIDKNYRGKGYAKIILKMAINTFELQKKIFIAEVKKNNLASINTFKRLKFTYEEYNDVCYFKLKKN
jgi:RimJ/RimL family protein N-acetyltransferase